MRRKTYASPTCTCASRRYSRKEGRADQEKKRKGAAPRGIPKSHAEQEGRTNGRTGNITGRSTRDLRREENLIHARPSSAFPRRNCHPDSAIAAKSRTAIGAPKRGGALSRRPPLMGAFLSSCVPRIGGVTAASALDLSRVTVSDSVLGDGGGGRPRNIRPQSLGVRARAFGGAFAGPTLPPPESIDSLPLDAFGKSKSDVAVTGARGACASPRNLAIPVMRPTEA